MDEDLIEISLQSIDYLSIELNALRFPSELKDRQTSMTIVGGSVSFESRLCSLTPQESYVSAYPYCNKLSKYAS